jgi:hypothetical protein
MNSWRSPTTREAEPTLLRVNYRFKGVHMRCCGFLPISFDDPGRKIRINHCLSSASEDGPMTEYSLRQRMFAVFPARACGTREYIPTVKTVSVRKLLCSCRLIHISGLHFSASNHTLDWQNDQLVIDTQDSKLKSKIIADFLCSTAHGPAFFGTSHVIITGDLTDSGDFGDYSVVVEFIERLKRRGFTVHVVPGNQDY